MNKRDLVARIGCVIRGLVQASRLQGTESNNRMSFSVSAMTTGRYCIRPPSKGTYNQTVQEVRLCVSSVLLLVWVCFCVEGG